jgi:hypothetical protein
MSQENVAKADIRRPIQDQTLLRAPRFLVDFAFAPSRAHFSP